MTVRCQDLLELTLDEPADAAISTATLHWIADHDTLFARIRDALAPGAPFVAQCGGAGNIANVMAVLDRVGRRTPFARAMAGWPGPWHDATADDTARRLDRARFDVARARCNPDLVIPDHPRDFLETIVLGAHLERLDPALRDAYVDAVWEELGAEPRLEFVRLNWIARRRR